MIVELTNEQMRAVAYKEDLIVDGETWQYAASEDDGYTEDEYGRYYSPIFYRSSDGKYFRITVFYTRCGYKNYEYDEFVQGKTAHEVIPKKISTMVWVEV